MKSSSLKAPWQYFSRLPYSRLILAVGTLQIACGVVLHVMWVSTGNWAWLRYYFDYQGNIYFIALDVFQFWLCLVAWKQFRQKDSLRSAWFAIALAMGFELAGNLLKHWLCVDTYINPLHYLWGAWNTSAVNIMQVIGSAIAGPVFMVALALGLLRGLRYYKKIGMLGKLKPLDFFLVGCVGIYGLYVIATVVEVSVRHPSDIRIGWVLTWPNDLLLALLLLEAILLMRTAFEMGPGYIVRAWGAFAAAIFLTSVESFGQWMVAYGHFPYPENSVLWYVWFIWAAAFALGPAYQVDAIRIAESRLEKASDPPYNNHMIHAVPGP